MVCGGRPPLIVLGWMWMLESKGYPQSCQSMTISPIMLYCLLLSSSVQHDLIALGQYSWTSVAGTGNCVTYMLGAGWLGTRSSQNHWLRASTPSPLLFGSCLPCRRNSIRVHICDFAYSLKFSCDLQVSLEIVSHLESFSQLFLHLAMHLKMFICKAKNDPSTAHLLHSGLTLSTLYFWEFSSFKKTPLLWPHWRTALGSQLPSWPSGEKSYIPLTCICGKLIALPNIYFPASASFILSSTLTSSEVALSF